MKKKRVHLDIPETKSITQLTSVSLRYCNAMCAGNCRPTLIRSQGKRSLTIISWTFSFTKQLWSTLNYRSRLSAGPKADLTALIIHPPSLIARIVSSVCLARCTIVFEHCFVTAVLEPVPLLYSMLFSHGQCEASDSSKQGSAYYLSRHEPAIDCQLIAMWRAKRFFFVQLFCVVQAWMQSKYQPSNDSLRSDHSRPPKHPPWFG